MGDRDVAVELAVRCAGYTGDPKDLYEDDRDRLVHAGVKKAIASLALICAHRQGTPFDQMIADAKAIFDQEFDPEYSWLWQLMLDSGGMSLGERGDLIEIYCSDERQRDQIVADLKQFGIRYSVEAAQDDTESSFVLIARGFLRAVGA